MSNKRLTRENHISPEEARIPGTLAPPHSPPAPRTHCEPMDGVVGVVELSQVLEVVELVQHGVLLDGVCWAQEGRENRSPLVPMATI